MKKLKLSLDVLKDEMESLILSEQNFLKGGYGGYYGYDTWNQFLTAVENGQIGDVTYYDVDQSETWDGSDPYGDTGGYAGYGGGGSGGGSSSYQLCVSDDDISYIINGHSTLYDGLL